MSAEMKSSSRGSVDPRDEGGPSKPTDDKTGDKTGDKNTSQHILFKVLDINNHVMFFKMNKFTPMKALMNSYCRRTGNLIYNQRFILDGYYVSECDTLSSLGMQNGDTIEVYPQQGGPYPYNSFII